MQELDPLNELELGEEEEKALEEEASRLLRVGDVVEVKGRKFRVKRITPKELRLKLLPRNKAEEYRKRMEAQVRQDKALEEARVARENAQLKETGSLTPTGGVIVTPKTQRSIWLPGDEE